MPQAISAIPNIKTEEQAKRLKELLKIKEQRHDAIVRFVNEHENDILHALQLAMSKDVISDEKDHYTEDEDEVTIDKAFSDRIRQWSIANHKMTHYMSRGVEDTMFPPQS